VRSTTRHGRCWPTPGSATVERVGRFLPALLDWQTGVTTTEDAFLVLDDWYDIHSDVIRLRHALTERLSHSLNL